jgi:hypothetical protein
MESFKKAADIVIFIKGLSSNNRLLKIPKLVGCREAKILTKRTNSEMKFMYSWSNMSKFGGCFLI